MIKILSHLFNLQFLKYLKVGVINTLCSLVIVYVLLFFEYDPYKSNLIGYIYGVFQSFFLNKAYVFSVEKLTSRHFLNNPRCHHLPCEYCEAGVVLVSG